MVEFLRIDPHLLRVAREGSEVLQPTRRADLARWVASLPPADLKKLATELLDGGDPGLRLETLRRFQASRAAPSVPHRPRSAGQLLEAAEKLRSRR